ncbi:zincin-like metallopeptidase domain-containing protein [Helicobacter sp. 10-6591]|uniref:ArdC family protein n=1 Tax=Helicobacter sp. 10-6591 TaxID=2004998 RepID=UPI0015EB9859|nr:zincin-like metallopeptidase domain-containing protein [Helicobacter sp. 10-6591]MCI7484332.1 zincin-like metallopeptidase domain-containing protein [Helicobacter sp.]
MSNKILEKLASDLEDRILKALENGTAPWTKPWRNDGLLPYNPFTGTQYKGLNALRLMINDNLENQYLTFNQVKELGGKIKKGSISIPIVFFTYEELKTQEEIDAYINEGKASLIREIGDKSYKLILKSHNVFNINQCEIDLEKLKEHQQKHNIKVPTPKSRNKFEPNPHIEQILSNSGVEIIHHKQDMAFYRPYDDKIYLPPKTSFLSEEEYYSTALHELGHATGHKKRLTRPTLINTNSFGTQEYAKEELRAELYSFLQAMELGIDYELKNHASYVGNWLTILKEDKSEISKAIKDSIKMVNYVKEHWYPKELQINHQQSLDKKPQQEKNENAIIPPKKAVKKAKSAKSLGR